MIPARRVLTIVACGAGPAAAIGTCVKLAQDRGWAVQVVATPAALDFFDQQAIADQSGSPVRSQYAKPGAPRPGSPTPSSSPRPPTTPSTKWAHGISDTYALGILAEATGLDVPIVVLPFVITALASRTPFRRSVESPRRRGDDPARPGAASSRTAPHRRRPDRQPSLVPRSR